MPNFGRLIYFRWMLVCVLNHSTLRELMSCKKNRMNNFKTNNKMKLLEKIFKFFVFILNLLNFNKNESETDHWCHCLYILLKIHLQTFSELLCCVVWFLPFVIIKILMHDKHLRIKSIVTFCVNWSVLFAGAMEIDKIDHVILLSYTCVDIENWLIKTLKIQKRNSAENDAHALILNNVSKITSSQKLTTSTIITHETPV